jgi:cell shape-determining protein MreD
MSGRLTGWLLVSLGVTVQFLLEVTLGRSSMAPAVLVPLLVYMSISRGDYWSVEGAFWSGFAMDLLLHHPPGISSLAMLLGIALSSWILEITTGAVRMTFIANAMIASILADLIFVFLASSPPGSGFSLETLLIVPRILLPLFLYLAVPLLFTGKIAETGYR